MKVYVEIKGEYINEKLFWNLCNIDFFIKLDVYPFIS